MQVVALKPPQGRLISMAAAVCAFTVLMAALPGIALPVALLLPLFVCPLIGTSKQWFALPGMLAPAAVALLTGQYPPYALSLTFCCALPAGATLLTRRRKQTGWMAYAAFIGAYVLAVALVLCSLQSLFPGRLADGIAQRVTDEMTASSDSLLALYRLAAAGFVSAPSSSAGRALWGLVLDPAITRQLSLSLRLTLSQAFYQLLPALVVHVCLLGGLFTALRVEQLNHRYLLVDAEKKGPVKMALTPGFSQLRMPRKCGGALTVMGLTGLVLMTTDSAWCQQLALLLYTAFAAGYALAGAAAMLRALQKRFPKAKALMGAPVALLYVLFNTVLFLFGVLDGLLHPSGGEGSQSERDEEDEQ